ncbi:hypothetical protein VN12_03435 [Pirellula sp. SH-Sr6A]|uniref:hypothetical protein n=1 Tax=Pirellula sp. SH-Sr6A TaxID=1632865 RepID=UPI00078BF3CA|nr:hypothetical protein [Pirellula sp. SH-Sr6A]AMV31144.1 hypothetical protein VN12_03435 [Pirellula sp. SH-Sr6A]
MKRKQMQSRQRANGLILLIALGMLAMFSLLAVTYVVAASASRTGSRGMLQNARRSNFDVEGSALKVVLGAVRGTNDTQSPFYKNDMLGDIYDSRPIETTFSAFTTTSSAQLFTVNPITAATRNLPDVALVKVTLSPQLGTVNALSDFENDYNSRILTVREGPLAGQSFRILKYVGQVGGTNVKPDPNVDNTPWSSKVYADAQASQTAYSILIDLNDIRGEQFQGQIYSGGRLRSVTMTLPNWIATNGIESLFYQPRPTAGSPFEGYSVLINGAPFNSFGIGIEEVAYLPSGSGPMVPSPSYGNIDSRRLFSIPSTGTKFSPMLLTDYDYLQNSSVMATNLSDGKVGVDGIGIPRNNLLEFRLNGNSNEGYDVPDFRDAWLAHKSYFTVPPTPTTPPSVIPSYHRPAVIQHIAHKMGSASGLTAAQAQQLLQLIDMSSARVMSYGAVNPGFMQNDPNYPRLSATPTTADLVAYVRRQIEGPWDVDNDGDGAPDSVWIDPNLPVVYSPEGRRLKPLAAIMIQDLDGRVNLNTAGDRTQATSDAFIPIAGAFKRSGMSLTNGFGYGPAEISLASFFGPGGVPPANAGAISPVLVSSPTHFSFFDERYGARRFPFYRLRPIDYSNILLDRFPGVRNANDPLSQIAEREFHAPHQHNRLPGLPLERRGSTGISFDLHGNPALAPTGNPVADELADDPYESSVASRPNSDDPIALTDLEAILRRYSQDTNSLPDRLKQVFLRAGFTNDNVSINVNDFIFDEITTRSGELRYPNIAAAMRVGTSSNAVSIEHQPPSYLRYLQWLHTQRHRTVATDPEISYAALAELFPVDFASGLRMDLNRPFGDGFDNDGDGQVDEPQEILLGNDRELFPGSAPTAGAYTRENQVDGVKPSETRRRLGSRQILARNLYCLAQLIVPRDYKFPGMQGIAITPATYWERSQIRARALAQWAVNVVDFRDADGAMTRFEYDIVPFGVGPTNAQSPIGARPAYWAPDRISNSVNGIPNRVYTGVVWGMEMPEALLSETLAIHDKRVRDTNRDFTGKLTTDTDPDDDFDQYRFPEASLFIEVTNPRTTTSPNNTVGAGSMGLPGVPSSLYTENDNVTPTLTNGLLALNLAKMAPATPGWGSQPVWRIAISQDYSVAQVTADRHPNRILENTNPLPSPITSYPEIGLTTHQQSFEQINSQPARLGNPNINDTNVTNLEQHIGNGLQYAVNDPSILSPDTGKLDGFERFIWFTSTRPTAAQNIPDIMSSLRSNSLQQQSVYCATTGNALLPGGGYLVIGPRNQTSFGSLKHNQFTNNAYPSVFDVTQMGQAANRPILSPSYQRIELSSGTVNTYLLNNRLANEAWVSGNSNIKAPQSLICTTLAPDDPMLAAELDWAEPFPDGIGINVSLPVPYRAANGGVTHPIHTRTNDKNVWADANRPLYRLNGMDLNSNRTDGTPGFGNTQIPPDSYLDTSATPIVGNFPDEPIDKGNPYLGSVGRYRTGTYENVRMAYLQRLADPEFGYDPVTNPYITVDWMSIDLTVFNGEANIGSESNDDSSTPSQLEIAFHSRYKDGRLSPLSPNLGAPQYGVSLYSPRTHELIRDINAFKPQTNPPTGQNGLNYESYFPYQLGFNLDISWPPNGTPLTQVSATTFGYANVGFHRLARGNPTATPPISPQQATTSTISTDFAGFGRPFSNAAPAYQGHTAHRQGLLWLNRPFASPYELSLVPSTDAGSFGVFHSGLGTQQFNPFLFVPSFQAVNAWSTFHTSLQVAEHDKSFWAVPPLDPNNVLAADWPLLLEFVETQPPFLDANKYLPPDQVLALSASSPIAARYINSFLPQNYYSGGAPPSANPATTRGPTLLAPFNRIPSYVASGKINLNTIAFNEQGRSRALESIDFAFSRGANVAGAFNQARHGYDLSNIPNNNFFGAPIGTFHPEFPTEFVGAFRPAMSANLAPVLGDPENNTIDALATNRMRSRYGVETTLLRSADIAANDVVTQSNSPLLFNNNTSDEVSVTQPFDRMQRAMRLPNMVTNQSNVFAVWVTVSLFEYDPINEFGNEYLGADGRPVRDRKFFIIDRSVPVGYKPGETLNADRTIMLQSQL